MVQRFSVSICLWGMLLSIGAMAAADELPEGFLDKTISIDGNEDQYVVYVPTDYSKEKRWPAVLFLHGSGERGSNNRNQLRKGLAPAIAEDPARCPALVVFPQSKSKSVVPIDGWLPGTIDGRRALAALDQTMSEYSIDPDRVYLTGMSMGGIGSWTHAISDPERWAAVVPICGGGNTNDAQRIAQLPIWCFHGSADATVPAVFSRMMVKSLKQAGGDPKYTEYPGVGHNSWDRAYREQELWTWLFAQKRASR